MGDFYIALNSWSMVDICPHLWLPRQFHCIFLLLSMKLNLFISFWQAIVKYIAHLTYMYKQRFSNFRAVWNCAMNYVKCKSYIGLCGSEREHPQPPQKRSLIIFR